MQSKSTYGQLHQKGKNTAGNLKASMLESAGPVIIRDYAKEEKQGGGVILRNEKAEQFVGVGSI